MAAIVSASTRLPCERVDGRRGRRLELVVLELDALVAQALGEVGARPRWSSW